MSDAPTLHLLKLCVGAASVEDLELWRKKQRALGLVDSRGAFRHVTRMWPRRADALLQGGSLYWVFSGLILARQRILALEPVDGEDGVRRCAIVMAPELVRTEAQPRRPFQGWRYLSADAAPADLARGAQQGGDAPPELEAALSALGVVARRS